MLAFDLYIVLGLFALVVLAVTAVLVALLVFAVQAGFAALWRWITRPRDDRSDTTPTRP